ncbi:MAG TPA: hypothetical protein VHP36_03440 [Chitinispirillaceae bacterium]|nr:hypothetical protein [Chitinispirillaceae bacterium]
MMQNHYSFKQSICDSEENLNQLIKDPKNNTCSNKSPDCQMITNVASGYKNRTAINSFLPLDLSDFYFTTFQNGAVPDWVQSNFEYTQKTGVFLKTQPGQNTITLE